MFGTMRSTAIIAFACGALVPCDAVAPPPVPGIPQGEDTYFRAVAATVQDALALRPDRGRARGGVAMIADRPDAGSAGAVDHSCGSAGLNRPVDERDAGPPAASDTRQKAGGSRDR